MSPNVEKGKRGHWAVGGGEVGGSVFDNWCLIFCGEDTAGRGLLWRVSAAHRPDTVVGKIQPIPEVGVNAYPRGPGQCPIPQPNPNPQITPTYLSNAIRIQHSVP